MGKIVKVEGREVEIEYDRKLDAFFVYDTPWFRPKTILGSGATLKEAIENAKPKGNFEKEKLAEKEIDLFIKHQ